MVLSSNKPMRKCQECGKEVRNLGYHYANVHPKILEQVEKPQESTPTQAYSSQLPRPPPQNTPIAGDLNALIREKLDTMLNIKIIEMLSKNPNTSLQEISQALNPPQPLGLREIKEYHDLVYKGSGLSSAAESGGANMADVIVAAAPIIERLLPAKKKEMEDVKSVEHSGNQERNRTILKPISLEASGDPGEPGSPGKEPGASGDSEQQNNISSK